MISAKFYKLCLGYNYHQFRCISFFEIIFYSKFSAEFDWTLILSWTYKLEQSQNTLKFERIQGTGENQIRDVYVFLIGQ
jgi:hypothetical protein